MKSSKFMRPSSFLLACGHLVRHSMRTRSVSATAGRVLPKSNSQSKVPASITSLMCCRVPGFTGTVRSNLLTNHMKVSTITWSCQRLRLLARNSFSICMLLLAKASSMLALLEQVRQLSLRTISLSWIRKPVRHNLYP